MAQEKTEYENAKEIINIKIIEATTNSMSIGKEINLNEIEKVIAESEETTVDKVYYLKAGNIQNSIGDKGLEGIVVSADDYSKYKFLIGKTCEIEKVILSDNFTETTDINDNNFIDIKKFETEIMRNRTTFICRKKR